MLRKWFKPLKKRFMETRKRLDQILIDHGFFDSKSQAQSAIRAGTVCIKDQILDKPGKLLSLDKIDEITITEKMRYVSRGGLKLEKALDVFSVNVKNKVCMDIGCSTGGFTDCLLQKGAGKVYAVDVGYGQFEYKLRHNKKVALFERTNIRYLDPNLIKEKIDIFVIDVSFISVTRFISRLIELAHKQFNIIILIKPQFEAKKGEVSKGVIKSKKLHFRIINDLQRYLNSIDLYLDQLTYSPVKGPKGNIEFLAIVKKCNRVISDNSIQQVIDQAHEL